MRILGVDPGFGILGWAIIENNFKIIEYGIIETPGTSNLEDRLYTVFIEINEIIDRFKPDTVAVEKLYFTKNTKTALDVAKCIGIILLAIKMNGLTYCEYTPSHVKQSITGYGRASKEQVQSMIAKLFKITTPFSRDDSADAIAIAACHYLTISGPGSKISINNS